MSRHILNAIRTFTLMTLITTCSYGKQPTDMKSDPFRLEIYPWNGKHELREDDILDHLRNHMTLDILDDYLPNLLRYDDERNEDGEMLFTNMEGQRFSAFVQKSVKKDKHKHPEHYDVDFLDAQLDGHCAVLSMDWWTYEWCHKQKVRQYHSFVEYKAEPVSTERIAVDPDWSLGQYTRSIVVRVGGDSHNYSAPITKIVDFFTGGQK